MFRGMDHVLIVCEDNRRLIHGYYELILLAAAIRLKGKESISRYLMKDFKFRVPIGLPRPFIVPSS